MPMTRGQHAALVQEFDKLLLSTNRKGVKELLSYLKTTDFYRAPASAQHHGSYPGGLLEHSLKVYHILKNKCEGPVWKQAQFDPASVIITALLHDLRKVNVFSEKMQNQKTYDKDAVANADPKDVKQDVLGSYVWESVKKYYYDEALPLGRAEKSLILAMRFIALTDDELYAIRWSDGFGDSDASKTQICKAFETYPLSLALYEADMEASFCQLEAKSATSVA